MEQTHEHKSVQAVTNVFRDYRSHVRVWVAVKGCRFVLMTVRDMNHANVCRRPLIPSHSNGAAKE